MKARRFMKARLWVEELEPRVVLSTAVPGLLESLAHSSIATQSTNWSGYAALPASGTVSMVSGSWVVPAVTGSGTAYSSFWVGIDGYSSSTVEQIGTDSDLQNGVPTYYAWYEMYPNYSVDVSLDLNGKAVAISPSDTISASVTYSSSAKNYSLTITDTTTGASFTTTQKLAGAKNSSAEWIAEAPSSNTGELPLANFSAVTFSNASATINGTTGPIDDSAWNDASINMVTGRNNTVVASTGALTDTAGTSSFTVTYEPPTAPPPPPPPPPGHHHGWGSGSGSGYGFGFGWRGPDGMLTPSVGAGDSANGPNAAAPMSLITAGSNPAGNTVFGGAATPAAPVVAAAHATVPAFAPLLSAATVTGPSASTPSDGGAMMNDDGDPVAILLPTGGSGARGGGLALAQTDNLHRQPALVSDAEPMQVIVGDHGREIFAAPAPEPNAAPTPVQDSGDGGSFMTRTLSKALWLVGAVAFAAHGALAERSREEEDKRRLSEM